MSKNPAISWRIFALPKRGHRAEEYEDACAGDPATGRFAVADGASESSFANIWAKLLVEGYVQPSARKTAADNWLAPLRKQWAKQVDGRELPWYAEEKREQGAFATFLGLRIVRSPEERGGRWKASAVGDSCMFQVRDDILLACFPLARSADFDTRPALIGSRPMKNDVRPKLEWGRWQPGDWFFLMTDALAQWFLARHEEKRKPWRSLLWRLTQKNGEAELTAYLEKLRDGKELKNDDVTLTAIGPLT